MSKFVKLSAIIFIFFIIMILPACTPYLAQEPTPAPQLTDVPTSLPESSELQGVIWVLQSMDDVQLITGSRITIRFTGSDSMEGNTGCRGYRGAYQIYGNSITFVTFNILGEKDACPDEDLRTQETAFTDYLKLCASYQLENNQLDIYTSDGVKLVFISEILSN